MTLILISPMLKIDKSKFIYSFRFIHWSKISIKLIFNLPFSRWFNVFSWQKYVSILKFLLFIHRLLFPVVSSDVFHGRFNSFSHFVWKLSLFSYSWLNCFRQLSFFIWLTKRITWLPGKSCASLAFRCFISSPEASTSLFRTFFLAKVRKV